MRQHPSTALVHEWVSSRAGSEKVFEALAQQYVDADLWCLSFDPEVQLELQGRTAATTFLDHRIFRNRRSLTLPLMPVAWRLLRAPHYERVISSHHAFAKGFRPARTAMHYCYVHTPARYLWSPELDDRGLSRAAKLLGPPLRELDRRSVRFVDSFAANSATVSRRIAEFWGRDSIVVPPPVDVDFFRPSSSIPEPKAPVQTLLSAGRFVEYKRHDLAIRAAARLRWRLVVAGSGPDEGRLRALAEQLGAKVDFRILPSDAELKQLYQEADVLLHLGVEDFGIIPVEAMACGARVVGLTSGGCSETVLDGDTGVLVEEPNDLTALASAIERAADLSPEACRSRAEVYSYEEFYRRSAAWIDSGEEG